MLVDYNQLSGGTYWTGIEACKLIWIFSFAIFLGAWLTFQIQPIIAKVILPEFGGLPIVWTASLLFFQAMLLAGYLYSHILAVTVSPRKAWYIHLALLIAAAWWLPPRGLVDESHLAGGSMIWSIVATLAMSVGPPFFVLAGTGPLLQWWWTLRASRVTPYRLYAASNLGSLLGLLSFPVAFESLAGLLWNARFWSATYVCFAVTCWFCRPAANPRADGDTSTNMLLARQQVDERRSEGALSRTSRLMSNVGPMLSWIVWSALACSLLMAVTNLLCQEVASFPFLWVAPLALYLLAFIVAFGWPDWYRRNGSLAIYLLALLNALGLYLLGTRAAILWQLIGFGAVCFFGAFICLGELYRVRPAERLLTAFYVMIAIGGLLGSALVVVVSPRVFVGFDEFHYSTSAIAVLAVAALMLDRRRQGLTFNWGAGAWLFGTLTVVILVISSIAPQPNQAFEYRRVFRGRSEYGLVSVYQTPTYRQIVSGQTGHGRQFLTPPDSQRPIDYYDADSGAGRAIQALRQLRTTANDGETAAIRLGVIGLGGGCLATWTLPGDEITFYEINPQIKDIAFTWFTYLRDSPGTVQVHLGDGRKLLEREWRESGSRQFDILFVDAFTSDSIPVHLLTRECRDLYWKHVRPDGIVAFHITNRFVDLSPIVYDEHQRNHRLAVLVDRTSQSDVETPSKWVLVSANREVFQSTWLVNYLDSWPPGLKAQVWTDDYSSVFWLVDWSPWIDWSEVARARRR